MPGRKVPASSKQKKAQLQEKRSVKRGELTLAATFAKKNTGVKDHLSRSARDATLDPDARQRARELQSRFKFLSVSPEYLAFTQKIAFEKPLERPIPSELMLFRSVVEREQTPEKRERARILDDRLNCPRRPKWRYGVTKKELEKNEEGNFAKWLQTVDDIQYEYSCLDDADASSGEEEEVVLVKEETEVEIRSPSVFERNLQVWRQLWRVGEQSNVILVLMDIRCPPVHFPASLRAYLRDLVGVADERNSNQGDQPGRSKKPKNAQSGRKKVVLVLTKADLVEVERQQEWKEWCKRWWVYGNHPPATHTGTEVLSEGTLKDIPEVVCVESYKREQADVKRHRHIPHIPETSLDALISAIKRAHVSLLDPPSTLVGDPDKVARWQTECYSRIKPEIDWMQLNQPGDFQNREPQTPIDITPENGESDMEENGSESESHEEPNEGDDDRTKAPRKATCLTIGLIGQPNNGKSSLLNALLGRSRVRASKTPGKTKHFQSIYWTSDVLIVDCPGLVFPSLTSVEVQVMSGVLPISQIPSIPACMYHTSRILPLETILKLPTPKRWAEEFAEHEARESKKTYRAGLGGPAAERDRGYHAQWTTGDIMVGWADHRGYVTAKAGRPDSNRAGNEILRMIAEGKIPWRFLSEDVKASAIESVNGVWIDLSHLQEDLEAVASDNEDAGVNLGETQKGYKAGYDVGAQARPAAANVSVTDEEASSDEDDQPGGQAGGMFQALAIEGGSSASDSEGDESD